MIKNNVLKILKIMLSHRIISIIVISGLIGGGYLGYKKIKDGESETRYLLSTAKKDTLVVSVSGSGQMSVLDQVDVKPEISGEITEVYINKDQEVETGKLLVLLDTEDAEKTVRDAEISLNDAVETLKKAEEDYEETIKTNDSSLESAYEEGLDSLASVFNDLNSIMPELELIFEESSYGDIESDINYYLRTVRYYTSNNGSNPLLFWTDNKPEEKFTILEAQFDTIRKEYLTINQNSSDSQIKDILGKTYDFTYSLLGLTRQTSNLIGEYRIIIEEENLTPPISSTIDESRISELTQFNSSLSSYAKDLKEAKESIIDLEEDNPKKIRDAKSAIDTARNDLTKKEESLSEAKEELENCFIRAPFDGLIAKVDIKKGDSVNTATSLFTLITHQKIAEISLNEVDAAKVKSGQKASLAFDALPEMILTGKVTEVDTIGTVSQGVVSYGVKIALDTDDERIKPGMSVTADIITEAKSNVLVLPNSAVKYQSGSYYVESVEIPDDKKEESLNSQTGIILPTVAKRQSVEVGISNDSLTEIISGVKEGDIVISSAINSSNQTTQSTQTQGSQQFQLPGMSGMR